MDKKDDLAECELMTRCAKPFNSIQLGFNLHIQSKLL